MRMTRRHIMKMALAAAGGVAANGLLAACGDATPALPTAMGAPFLAASPTPISPPSTRLATTAMSAPSPSVVAETAMSGKRINELRIGIPTFPDSMDPQEAIFNQRLLVHYFHFDTLLRRDFLDGNKLVPGLATEWKRTDDRTLEMTLRRGVAWHDGSPFTAADVKYTFERILSKDPKLAVASPTYFPLASVESLDDYRVRFVSSTTDPLMEKRFAGVGAQVIPARYHQQVGAAEFRTRSIGTGPYRLVEYVAGDRLTFEANDTYFGGAPAARRVSVRVIPEVATRVAALQAGDVDLITNVPPDLIPTLSTRKDVTVRSVPQANIYTLQHTMKVAPFQKREIRQAVGFAIDRKALAEQLWGGNATETRGYQFEGEDFFDATRPFTVYNPDQAKRLLAQGGYAGEEIVYLASSPGNLTLEKETGEAIVGMWRAAGINGKLDFLDFAQKWGGGFGETRYHTASGSFNNNVADPDGYLWRGWGADATVQKKGWWFAESANEFNRLGQEARTALDRTQRGEKYRRMMELFETEAPGATLFQPKETYAMRANIDWTPYPLYYLDLRAYNLRIK